MGHCHPALAARILIMRNLDLKSVTW